MAILCYINMSFGRTMCRLKEVRWTTEYLELQSHDWLREYW